MKCGGLPWSIKLLIPSSRSSSEKWLKGRRERFIFTTMAGGPMGSMPWNAGTSRKHLLSAIDASLTRLGTD